jgi:thiamine biosynthesis protein ThiS
MRLIINGQERDAPALASLAELSVWLGLPAFGSAIELNGEVVPKANQAEAPIRDGDRLEIVRLVGGG